MRTAQLFFAGALVASASAGAVDLNSDNFDELVTKSGKAAFIKFLAPW
jgi:hypothetical protein